MMPLGLGVKVTHTNQGPTLPLCAIMTYATFIPEDSMALDGGIYLHSLLKNVWE